MSNNISMIRGDTLILRINITPAILTADDIVRFTANRIRTSTGIVELTSDAVIIDDSSAIITIPPESTANLGIGGYNYDIRLRQATGEVHTLIARSIFFILPEVTQFA